MARKEITTPLDLKNLDNHNYNYDELYGLIDETDRRISEDMWEEIKGANTMKMLEPVQTAADLPSEAADKSLITVIDEQRVYGFVNGEWQPFSEIDLDPFEPFKDELAEIVAAYEDKIQSITQEVQSTKDSAIDSIESTQSQSESNISQTEQSAINSVNQAQQAAESQISDSTEALQGKTEELTSMFNDYLEQLTSNQDTTLAEVDSAKQEAITALENFQNTDTSNWQKFKLTNDDGTVKDLSGVDWADTAQLDALDVGVYYSTTGVNIPVGASSYNAFITVTKRVGEGIKRIEYKPYNSTQTFIKRFYETWSDWEPLGGTKVALFDGSINGVGSVVKLNDDLSKYSALIISGSVPGGTFNELVLTETIGSDVSIQKLNLRNSSGQFLGIYEVNLNVKDNQTLEVTNDVSWDEVSGSGSGEGRDAYSFIHIEGWK